MSYAVSVIERQPATRIANGADARAVPAAGVRDTARVDVENWHSVRYWSETMGVSESQLLRATRAVGTLVLRLETHFAEKRANRRRRRVAEAG